MSLSQELTPSNTSQFLERFGDFHDALIRDIHLRFGLEQDTWLGEEAGSTIVVSVQDLSTPDEQWINVILNIEAVSEMKLTLDNWTTGVIFEVGVGFFDGKVYLSIGNAAKNINAFRNSSFMLAGKKCFWASSAYQEGNEYDFAGTL